VDASGEILRSQDLDGTFNGVVELSRRLAGSASVRACLTAQWSGMRWDVREASGDARVHQERGRMRSASRRSA